MINRDQLRAQKQADCDAWVEQIHRQYPRLEEIANEISMLSIQRIRATINLHDKRLAQDIDQRVQELMNEKRQLLAAHQLDQIGRAHV